MRPELHQAFEELRSNERMAAMVTRRDRRLLFALTVALSCLGLLIGWWRDDYTWFARSGAAVSFCAFSLASQTLRLQRAWQLVSMELVDEKMGDDRATLEPFILAIQRRLTADHIGVAAFGTLVWGFGDLIHYVL